MDGYMDGWIAQFLSAMPQSVRKKEGKTKKSVPSTMRESKKRRVVADLVVLLRPA